MAFGYTDCACTLCTEFAKFSISGPAFCPQCMEAGCPKKFGIKYAKPRCFRLEQLASKPKIKRRLGFRGIKAPG